MTLQISLMLDLKPSMNRREVDGLRVRGADDADADVVVAAALSVATDG